MWSPAQLVKQILLVIYFYISSYLGLVVPHRDKSANNWSQFDVLRCNKSIIMGLNAPDYDPWIISTITICDGCPGPASLLIFILHEADDVTIIMFKVTLSSSQLTQAIRNPRLIT